jgi:predicted ribosomally synthesized peptide with nif11-like leader
MSVENVREFYQRMEEDEAFRAEIAIDGTLKDTIADRVVAVAARHGYEFTAADYAAAMEDSELSDSELEKIAGGQRQSPTNPNPPPPPSSRR